MNTPNPEAKSPVCGPVRDALTSAIESGEKVILESEDLYDAFLSVSHAAEKLRESAEHFANLRAVLAARIADRERLSQIQLANRLGISRSRSGQLLTIGRRNQHLIPQNETPDAAEHRADEAEPPDEN